MQAGEIVNGPAQPEVVQWTGIRIRKYADAEPAGLVVHVVGRPEETEACSARLPEPVHPAAHYTRSASPPVPEDADQPH